MSDEQSQFPATDEQTGRYLGTFNTKDQAESAQFDARMENARAESNRQQEVAQQAAENQRAAENNPAPLPGDADAPPTTDGPDRPTPPRYRPPRRLWSKALIVTVPVSLLFLTVQVSTSSGGTVSIPLWERLIPTVLFAALGSPRLRFRAFIALVVVIVGWWMLGGPS